MSKKRTTISLNESLLEKAQSKGVNVSAITERALRDEITEPQYHMVNTSKNWLEERCEEEIDTASIYSEGVAAQFGGLDRGTNIEQGDYVISYVDGEGARAVGRVLSGWHEDPIEPENRVVLPENHEEDEYHLPVYWLAVVTPENALESSLLKEIAGRPIFNSTHTSLSREDDNAEIILDTIIGRSYRT